MIYVILEEKNKKLCRNLYRYRHKKNKKKFEKNLRYRKKKKYSRIRFKTEIPKKPDIKVKNDFKTLLLKFLRK